MADILGFLAGTGMAALVGTLIVVFLRQMSWMRQDAARLLGRSAALVGAAGAVYLLLAMLNRLALYGKIEGDIGLAALFRGPYMTRMLAALIDPAEVGPVSLAFAWISHLLGRALFGQFVFSGLLLAWLMTGAGIYLIQLRFEKITDAKTARDTALLLLFLPGGVFFLLPGWAPVCLLFAASLFYFLTRKTRAWKLRYSPAGFGWLIAVCALLSAAVTVCVAEGRIG